MKPTNRQINTCTIQQWLFEEAQGAFDIDFGESGSQEALFLFYSCHLGPGDHVLTFTPGWQQSWDVPLHMGAEVTKLPLAAESNYAIDWDMVAAAVKENTRLLILCYPNNPLGLALSGHDRERLERLQANSALHVLIDEEYLTDYRASVFCRRPGSYAVSSLSKIYGFPGLRLGWFVGDEEAVERVVNLKRYTTVCNSSICKYFALQEGLARITALLGA